MAIPFIIARHGHAVSGLALLLMAAQAGAIDSTSRVHSGILACGGNHFARVGDTEEHRTSYTFRNLSEKGTIGIARLAVLDANGSILFDFPTESLPADAKTVLAPLQSTQINTRDIVPGDLDAAVRPIQIRVYWSYAPKQRDVALHGSFVQTVRDSGNGPERSRSGSDCTLVAYRR